MKKEIGSLKGIVLVLIAGLMLSSCSKKDSDSDPAGNLNGRWVFSDAIFTSKVGTKSLTQYLTDEIGLSEAQAQQFMLLFNAQVKQAFMGDINLKSNGTYTSTLGGTPDSGTWSVSKGNDKLTLTSDAEGPTIFDILELTASKLVIKGTEVFDYDLDGDYDDETVTVTVELTLTK